MTILPDLYLHMNSPACFGVFDLFCFRRAWSSSVALHCDRAARDAECIPSGIPMTPQSLSLKAPRNRRGIHVPFGRLRHGHEAKPGSHTAQPRRDYLLPRFWNGQGQATEHFRSKWFSM
jgi:hypothetical protein